MKARKNRTRAATLIISMILLATIVSATIITYTNNRMTASVEVKTTCNDGIDNDADGSIDSANPAACASICDSENLSTDIKCI
ncbi:MAG TPA: hypothetical protein VJI75_01995 [Candidatus Nanoarchaeia archaeon]|nr:hypothetical protein [Candidatus Nanoarchaeia archaeon]